MKKPFLALLLLVGAAAMVAGSAFAGVDEPSNNELGNKLVNANSVRELLNSRASKLGTSAGVDPDTVWFGHSYTNHFSATTNYWNLWTGVNQPGQVNPNNAIWDWDHSTGFGAVTGDSLAGWWPTRRAYAIAGGLTLPDNQRPWWAFDMGNVGNYVINQGAGGKRTVGVVGYWHHDVGSAGGTGVTWSPIAGAKSAWCGLRQHGDNSVKDLVTGNPYNQTVLEMQGETGGGSGTNKRFPGYTNAMDQMLYRDIALTLGSTLNVSFLYRTRMSTDRGTAAATRTGWFHGDPLAVTTGNFISSSAAGDANAPIDSFSVYIGSPVNDAACRYSDGVTRPVYDVQRRWFSEVLRINEGASVPYYELFSAFGANPSDTLTATPSFGVTVPATLVNSILSSTGNPGRVRLVFRVKTNISFSDGDSRASGYTSATRGAAIIDNVVVNGNTIGDFEGAEQGGVNAIDNRPGASPLNNWKSTGKPPSIWFHTEDLNNLTYNDLCGPPNSPARFCNIGGVVITGGNHDDGEKSGDSRFTVDREVQHAFMSPTVDMIAGATPNNQGLTSTIIDATDDIYIWYDMYAGAFNLSFTGNAWVYAAQAYPSIQTGNGTKCWGETRWPTFQIFNPEPQCFQDIEGLYGTGLIVTSNATGVPDSLRFLLGVNQQCFRFAVSLGCNSSEGAYFDNISLGFIDIPLSQQTASGSAITLGSVTSDIWQFANDAFPSNETNGLPGSALFDTTTALIKTGINNAQATGNALRFDIPGDSLVIKASNATTGTGDDPAYKPIRIDLVFRVLPGPGNYRISAGRTFPPAASQVLLQVPTNQAAAVVPGDASFWGQYITAPGQFSKGDHFGGTRWDYLTWNSARCDSAQVNFFGNSPAANTWMGTYHESDPKFATLGTNKFKCFIVDTTKAATSTGALNNVICDGTLPAWLTTVPQSRTGWDGSATTKEFTKIIPDGLLTPGSHVQYFYRKSHNIDPLFAFAMCPDTTTITPQNGEGSSDGHRWQQFSVLPDRYKDPAFGGTGMACMLYVDYNDRRGNERQFVSVMDSIGGTASTKFGAHNGWHAAGGASLGAGSGNNPAIAISNRNSQPGTTWDMYGVKASESLTTSAGALGSRLANRASMGFATGKESRSGPTPEMLRTYYRVVAILSGDLTSGILGPFANRSQNDIALLNDYLTNAAGSAQPRGLFIQGDGFAQSETQTGGVDPAHTTFMSTKLGLSLRNASYQSVSGNTNDCTDLVTTNIITTNGDVYGVANLCLWSNDLYTRNAGIPEALEASFYQNVGVNGPYVASVRKSATVTRNWVALTDGWEIEHLLSRYCDTDNGRLAYYYNALNNVFGSICTLTGGPLVTLDTPNNGHGAQFANFMKVTNNLMKSGAAKVTFGLARSQDVQVKVFDVTGREVFTLANRAFQAGEHSLTWDGRDNSGSQVARGVYFARVITKDGNLNKAGKVIVLR